MERNFVRLVCLTILFVTGICIGAIARNDNESFAVERMVTTEGIEDREPIGLDTAFPADIDRVYCFLEARNIEHDTEVTFVWYAGDMQVAEITVPLQAGPRWRTFSYKTIGGVAGEWRVELLDENGNTVNSIEFTTE
jgi:hypothetical protein